MGNRVLIICSHEPELDPRIDWSARYAPADIERIVVGFHDARRIKPDEEIVAPGSHKIIRLRRDSADSIRLLGRTVKSFFLHAPLYLRVVCGLLLLVGAMPILFVYEVLNFAYNLLTFNWIGFFRAAVGPFLRRSFIGAGLRKIFRKVMPGGTKLVRRWLRAAGMERLVIIVAVLLHFAHTNSRLLECCRSLRPIKAIHANDLDTLIAAVLLKWETGCRVIYDSHEFWPYSDVNASRFEEMFWAFVERVLLKHVDAAFTVSGPLARAISIESGHEFGEVPNAEPTREDFDRLLVRDAANGQVRFLFLGTFSPKRGLEELIESWAQINDGRAQLVLRGPQSPDRDQMIALASSLGVIGRTVHFLEPVLESELVASAADFDVGVIPYKPASLAYRFCCPNKLSQYMQAGVAVLTNDLVYVKEVVRRYDCGLAYDSSKPGTLHEAVATIVQDPKLLTKLRRNAKEAARTDFNWQRKSVPLYEAYH